MLNFFLVFTQSSHFTSYLLLSRLGLGVLVGCLDMASSRWYPDKYENDDRKNSSRLGGLC